MVGMAHSVALPALSRHKQPAQGTQSPLLGGYLAFRLFLYAGGCTEVDVEIFQFQETFNWWPGMTGRTSVSGLCWPNTLITRGESR